MISEECKIAYAEVLEIMDSISYMDYIKIPIEKIQLLKKYAKKEIDFIYNPNLTLGEQNVSEKAKTIIALLFRVIGLLHYKEKKLLQKKNLIDKN